jgi:periplasmic copper chaperone A
MLRRLTLVTALVLVLFLWSVGPAMAHTELEPSEATSGSVETLTFHVAYEGVATTGLDVELPDGASVVEVPAKEGWTAQSDPEENRVTWTGGPVEADEEFAIVVQLPNEVGVLLFPAIQLTTEGEVEWISPEEGEGHDSNPAPRLTLVADPNATTTTTSEAPTSTTADLPDTTVEAANDGDGGSATPWLIGAAIAAIVAIAIGGTLLKRHADRGEASATDGVGPPEGGGGGAPS